MSHVKDKYNYINTLGQDALHKLRNGTNVLVLLPKMLNNPLLSFINAHKNVLINSLDILKGLFRGSAKLACEIRTLL